MALKKKPVTGMKDILPKEMEIRNYVMNMIRETYGSKIKVFDSVIPYSVRAKESSKKGKSVFAHEPEGKVAEGYRNLTKEVLQLERQREKIRSGLVR